MEPTRDESNPNPPFSTFPFKNMARYGNAIFRPSEKTKPNTSKK
jgi:hypothetical protein